MQSNENPISETDRVGDRHGTWRVVVVVPPTTISLVRDLVEGRLLFKPRRHYRWAGHGSYTKIESAGRGDGMFCPLCAKHRALCKCQKFFGGEQE